MRLNDLLLWMSARVEGSWQQFRDAANKFDLSKYQTVRYDLSKLAHVEFTNKNNEAKNWRVVPPAISVMKHGEQWIGFACGARSSALLSKLQRINGPVSCDVSKHAGMPDRIQLAAPSFEELFETAQSIGFLIQKEAPESLLSALPPADDFRYWVSSEFPPGTGWTIKRFSPSDLRWDETTLHKVANEHYGLFRFMMEHQRFHFLIWRGKTFKINVQIGKYMVLRQKRQNVIRYDRSLGQILVPPICAPPLLIERAFVLCSGALPVFSRDSGCLTYIGVPERVARFAAQLLRQELL